MLLVAPRIVNSVSCVKRIQHEIYFSWQAQYLVRLEDVACRSAHCNSRFMCEEETRSHYISKNGRQRVNITLSM